MQYTGMQELLHSHPPKSNLSPIVKVNQLNQSVDDRRKIGWFLKNEEDELAGYVFDSDLLREGSDGLTLMSVCDTSRPSVSRSV